MRSVGLSGQIVRVLWWSSVALLVAGGVVWAARLPLPAGVPLGAGLALLGLNVLIGGDVSTGAALRGYTARGAVARGHLEARCGLSDLHVGACGADRLAQTQFGPVGKPIFDEIDGVAYLRLAAPRFLPSMALWAAHIAPNVLWDINVRSTLGHLTLDLGELRTEQVTVRTALGRVSLGCGSRGYTRITIHAGLGEVILRVPPDAEARVKVVRGALSDLTIKNERFLALGRDRFATPGFKTSTAQVEVEVITRLGDVLIV